MRKAVLPHWATPRYHQPPSAGRRFRPTRSRGLTSGRSAAN